MSAEPTVASGAACPECGEPSRVVTCVTVRTLPPPRNILVTRQCRASACQFKFPVFRSEPDLDDDERRVWRAR